LKMAVESGVVKYYRNSTLLYTSTVAPPYPLQVDTSLNTVNAGVYNVVISGARLTASPINYVLQDVQGSTRAVMSGTSVIARHDFLPFGEEIGAGVGMRTGGQGFGVTDKIRQRYAMTEHDDTTGLDHTWWRKHEDRSGRWTSADPYPGSMRITNPQSFNRYAYVKSDPLNSVDPTGLCTPLNFFLDIFVDGVRVAHIDFGTVGYTGCSGAGHRPPGEPREPGEPQNRPPQIDQKKYDDCAKLLGKSPAPSKVATEAILWTSSQEGTNSTLIAVTWAKESGFDFRPGPNPREDGGFDVGPLQTSTTYFGKDRFLNGLSDDAGEVMGTFATKGVPFNGDPYLALRWGARALNDGAGRGGRPKGVSARADMAGLYRAGSRSGPYQTRVNEFNAIKPGYDAFFNCLRK